MKQQKKMAGLRRGQCRRHRPWRRPYGQVYAEGVALGVDRRTRSRHVARSSPGKLALCRGGCPQRRRPAGCTSSRHVAPFVAGSLPYAEGRPSASADAPLTATSRRQETPRAATPRGPAGRRRRSRTPRARRTPTARLATPRDLEAEGCRRRSLRRWPGAATPRAAGRRQRAPFL